MLGLEAQTYVGGVMAIGHWDIMIHRWCGTTSLLFGFLLRLVLMPLRDSSLDQEPNTCGGVIHSPVVPLVASSPQPLEVTLVDEKLVPTINDDQQGQEDYCG
ncbi:hypothetical protein CK203_075359 [Vitis vinifera]|uniref:Uncharacterized protein n=1 Tax=Vitis vinifera TaxID=29760 RepID=A0A438BXH8_VITVI|nr:hypothetical protein CK203_075359 [Vitis vinifera]